MIDCTHPTLCATTDNEHQPIFFCIDCGQLADKGERKIVSEWQLKKIWQDRWAKVERN
jgi:Fe2+ or Zn2+ uptake regulation protein